MYFAFHPQGARVYGAVVESEVIRRRSRLLPESLACLRTGNVSITVEESYTCEVPCACARSRVSMFACCAHSFKPS